MIKIYKKKYHNKNKIFSKNKNFEKLNKIK